MHGNDWKCMEMHGWGILVNSWGRLRMLENALRMLGKLGMLANSCKFLGKVVNACKCLGMLGECGECLGMHGE